MFAYRDEKTEEGTRSFLFMHQSKNTVAQLDSITLRPSSGTKFPTRFMKLKTDRVFSENRTNRMLLSRMILSSFSWNESQADIEHPTWPQGYSASSELKI